MSFWNPARVEQLRELITREGSAAQIAAELNRGSIEFVTRNAVISKIHRQGWIDVWARAGHPGPVRGTPAPVRVKAPRPAHAQFNGLVKPVAPTAVAPPTRRDRETPVHQRCALQELNGHTCRWPVGEPGAPNFFFCGAEPSPDRPYCKKHCRVAYAGTRKTVIP